MSQVFREETRLAPSGHPRVRLPKGFRDTRLSSSLQRASLQALNVTRHPCDCAGILAGASCCKRLSAFNICRDLISKAKASHVTRAHFPSKVQELLSMLCSPCAKRGAVQNCNLCALNRFTMRSFKTRQDSSCFSNKQATTSVSAS